jgi:hypothetical protein
MGENIHENNLGGSSCGLVWSIVRNPPRSTEEGYENLNPNSRNLGRDLSPQPPEYEAEMLRIFWATFSFTTCVRWQWTVVRAVDSHTENRRNSSCCLVQNKYHLNVFSESIYCVSFEFIAWIEVINEPWFHLYNRWRHKYRKQFTPPYCSRMPHPEPTAFDPLWKMCYNEFLHLAPLPVCCYSERNSVAGYLSHGFCLCWRKYDVV